MIKILISIIISAILGAAVGYSYQLAIPPVTDPVKLPLLYVVLGLAAIYIVSLLLFTKTIVYSFINIFLSAFLIVIVAVLTITFLMPEFNFAILYEINKEQILSSQMNLNLLSYLLLALGPVIANLPVGLGEGSKSKSGKKPAPKKEKPKTEKKKEDKKGKKGKEEKSAPQAEQEAAPAAAAAAPQSGPPKLTKQYEPIDISKKLESIPGPQLAFAAHKGAFAAQPEQTMRMTPEEMSAMMNASVGELHQTTPPAAPTGGGNVGPLGESVFDSSFDNLIAAHPQPTMAPPPPPPPPPQQPPTTSREDISAKVASDSTSGKLNAGKMLLDTDSINKIVANKEDTREVITKAGLSSTRVISAAKGHSLDALLSDINNIKGVKGSIIVGRDGLLIDSTIKDATPKELIGAVASSIYSNVEVATNRMQRGQLKQMFLSTDMGLSVINDLENLGLLIVLTDKEAESHLVELLNAIRTTIEVSRMVGRK